MKRALIFAAFVFLFVAGCRKPSRDEISLQPYSNIPRGTTVMVQMRLQGNLGFDVITTNEYVLEKFEDGFVTLRGTNGLSLGYAGSLIRSIERKK